MRHKLVELIKEDVKHLNILVIKPLDAINIADTIATRINGKFHKITEQDLMGAVQYIHDYFSLEEYKNITDDGYIAVFAEYIKNFATA